MLALAGGLLLFAAAPAGAFDQCIDSPMYRLPDLPDPPVEYVFAPELKVLWLRALERPEAEMRLNAAAAIILAHRRGMKGLESTIDPLVKALDAPDQDDAVRQKVAQALIALDARQSAPRLFAQAQAGGLEFRETVEPVLALWDHRPARAAWLGRIQSPVTPARSLTVAIQLLGVLRDEQAAPRLRELAIAASTTGPIRLEAARALGEIRPAGLEADAELLAADATPRGLSSRLAAALLLHRHTSPPAVALLNRLARDPEPAVAVNAAWRLFAIDPALTLPMLDLLLGHADPQMRLLGVEVMHRLPTRDRLRLLGDRLQDAHPDVRVKARERLLELAALKEHREYILDEATRVLAQDDWRGIEHAAILLTQLQHRPAAARLVQLLTTDRPEAFITVAWGLRKLAVPETLPPVLNYVRQEFERSTTSRPLAGRKAVPGDATSHQLSQLNQLLGQERYQPADAVLRKFVPKRMDLIEGRAAAVWALGLLHEGKNDAELADELAGRLNEINAIPPEHPAVRRMSAVALGRMQAAETLPSLRRFFTPEKAVNDLVARGCGWAIARITGEPAPAAATVRRVYPDWFLAPHP
jgi:hypothetical protein